MEAALFRLVGQVGLEPTMVQYRARLLRKMGRGFFGILPWKRIRLVALRFFDAVPENSGRHGMRPRADTALLQTYLCLSDTGCGSFQRGIFHDRQRILRKRIGL